MSGPRVQLGPELLAEIKRGEAGANGDGTRSTLTDFTEIVAKPVEFLWSERIALGKITALSGRPKIGKGLLYTNLIAKLTRGTLTGDRAGVPGRAIIVTTEDEPGDTLKPRLMAANADLSRVSMFQMGSKEEPVPFRIPQDTEELGRRVAETKTDLVVIDPLIEFIDGKADTHKSHDARQVVSAVNVIAREHRCAVLSIIHLNKGASTDPLLRMEGSAAFTQIVRAGLMLGFDPDDPEGEEGDQPVLAVSSSNLARLAPSLVYRIEGATVQGGAGEPISTASMACVGESAAASHDLLGGREDDDVRADRDEALEFLRVELEDGPRPAREIKRAAEAAGVGPNGLRRAKRELHVRSQKSGMTDGWTWVLPEGDGPKGMPPIREKPSPSSPSWRNAGLEGVDSPKGMALTDTTPSADEQLAEAERLAAKFPELAGDDLSDLAGQEVAEARIAERREREVEDAKVSKAVCTCGAGLGVNDDGDCAKCGKPAPRAA